MTVASIHVRGAWTTDRAVLSMVAAIAPSLMVTLFDRGATLFLPLIAALLVSLFWQTVFAWLRRLPLGWDWAFTAIAFIVLVPAATPLWQSVLAITFGVVVGEQIFGGRGRAFLSPAIVALAFLFFSFPAVESVNGSNWLVVTALLGALGLAVLGLISWRILVGALLGLTAAAMLSGFAESLASIYSGSIVFGLVFLGCDPVSAAATNPGRFIYGFMIGVLTVVFGAAGTPAIVFAVLLSSIFAPLIDHIVVQVHAYRRRRSFG